MGNEHVQRNLQSKGSSGIPNLKQAYPHIDPGAATGPDSVTGSGSLFSSHKVSELLLRLTELLLDITELQKSQR